MELITAALPHASELPVAAVPIPADRLTLAKRRWRGVAADGREFGFDLERPLADGDAVFATEAAVYRLAQQPEPVLEIALAGAADAARLGWLLGNLHFRIAVAGGAVRAPNDPAIRQLLEREHIHYHEARAVFQPLSGGHSHGQHHEH